MRMFTEGMIILRCDMNMQMPYSHPPIEWVNEDGYRECRSCGRQLTGWADTLRHMDEAVRPTEASPAEAAVIRLYVEVIHEALENMWTERCSDLDRAQVAAEALRRRGLVTARKKRRRSPSAV